MDAKTVIIRALSCVDFYGFKSREEAAYEGCPSTAQRVRESFISTPVSLEVDEIKYGDKANAIIDWITNVVSTNDYIDACKNALHLVETNPDKSYGLLCSLPSAFTKHNSQKYDVSVITKRLEFVDDVGKSVVGLKGTVLCKYHYDLYKYTKYSIVDTNGHLVIFYVSDNKSLRKTSNFDVGDEIEFTTGTIKTQRFVDPFETIINKAVVIKC